MEKTVFRRDGNTTVGDLKEVVKQFVDERDWQKFHSAKNLSMALAIEVSELMEHFQWISCEASRELDDDTLHDVGEELSDVFCYTLAIANELGLDLTANFTNKMRKNVEKYPAEEFRGRYGLDDPNPVSKS